MAYMGNIDIAIPTDISAIIPDSASIVDGDIAKGSDFARAMKAPLFIAERLVSMGIADLDSARAFFKPSPDCIAAPTQMADMPEAVKLLQGIREQKAPILVHGDYDVDGIAGAAVLYLGFKALGLEVNWFLPDRFKDGYGLSKKHLRRFVSEGYQWIVTVDTGISALEEIAEAKSLGLKVIITDHHQAPPHLPPAEAILNPNRPGCAYPNKGLCGAGVAYKLVQALHTSLGLSDPQSILLSNPESLLDFVALASLADMAPMVGENRYLVKQGLLQIERTQHPGLLALLNQAGLLANIQRGEHLSAQDVMFKITPLLNAPGRMSHSGLSMEALIASDAAEAREKVERIVVLNEERKKLDKTIFEAARQQAEVQHRNHDACLVVHSEGWHEGVIGIVAAKLVELYQKPAFVLTASGEHFKGSGRTVTGFHLHKALSACDDLLLKWGGHYYACGFSIDTIKLPHFAERLKSLALTHLKDAPQNIRSVGQIPVAVSLSDVTADMMLWLSRFEPTGPLNEPVHFCSEAYVSGAPRILSGAHLKLSLTDTPRGRPLFEAIGFGLGIGPNAQLAIGQKVAFTFYPQWNYFNGKKSLQLRLTSVISICD